MNVNDIRMRIIDRHTNLRPVCLPQYSGEKQRMLFDFSISEPASLDNPVSEFLHFILDEIVDRAAGRARDFESVGDELLMEYVEVRSIDRIFHGLKPVTVEPRQRAKPVPAIGAR